MINNVVEKLYGIDYTTYICGGIGNARLNSYSKERELFYTEAEMLKRLSELKKEEIRNVVGDFELFTATINKQEYKL